MSSSYCFASKETEEQSLEGWLLFFFCIYLIGVGRVFAFGACLQRAGLPVTAGRPACNGGQVQ